MSTKRIFCWSLIIGATMEGAILGFQMLFGRIGPCGPGNLVGMIFMYAHIPGWHVANIFLPEDNSLNLPLAFIVTGTIWTLLVFIFLNCRKRLCSRAK